MRSGNAHIHGMTRVTPASLAYVATQVRIVLSKHYNLEAEHLASSTLCYHRRRYSVGLTQRRTLSVSMRVS